MNLLEPSFPNHFVVALVAHLKFRLKFWFVNSKEINHTTFDTLTEYLKLIQFVTQNKILWTGKKMLIFGVSALRQICEFEGTYLIKYWSFGMSTNLIIFFFQSKSCFSNLLSDFWRQSGSVGWRLKFLMTFGSFEGRFLLLHLVHVDDILQRN